jgi:hypothetical protein
VLSVLKVYTKKNADLHRVGRSAQTAFLLHIVSYVAARNQHPPGLQVSHLCDTRRCFNPDHLVAESIAINNSRKGCAGPIACTVHGHIVVDLCAHIPRCIRPPREDVICCLAIRESDPQAWASQEGSPQGTGGSRAREGSSAMSVLSRESSEFSGAEWLQEAVEAGVI